MAAQGPVSAALGEDAPAYRVRGLQTVNPAQHLRAGFSRRGLAVVSGTAELGMTLSAYGHGSALRQLGSAVPRASGNRVSYAHRGVTEWYANGPLGIEQGFDLAARPGVAAGPLTLSLALSGNLEARLRDGSVLFTGDGATLRYGGLVATDASGRTLPSWLHVAGDHVLIRVDDRGAAYPLRVDPMIQQGQKLTAADATPGTGRFGYAVALSADGDTALIGARYGNVGVESGIGAGAAWVFVRSGSTWSQQGAKLVGTGHAGEGEFAHVGEGEFGTSVALSDDGDTALIGGPADDDGVGAAWVFTRSGSTWTQQGAKLTGAGETGKAGFGSSVALSGDGNTALVGGWFDDGGTGAAWVFTRSGSTWTQQGAKLTGAGEVGEGRFGTSVALSDAGDTALVGGRFDDDNGAAWVFTRSGSTWSQQGEKLTASDEDGAGRFGDSVALSGDGDTALIGGPADNSNIGAAWAFTRSGSTWTQQGNKLTGGGESGEAEFGDSVALSADGDTALIGGGFDDSGAGAAWAFTRSSSTWTQQGNKLTGGGETGAARFGFEVALSEDGGTALVGGPEDAAARGAAWVLTRSGSTWSQQGAKLTGAEEDNSEFGVLVSLSADGNTALVGGWNDDGRKGAAWVFTRSGGVWSQQGPKLTAGSESESGAGFGTSVALSADGNTALVGAPGDENRKGAAWVFTRSGSTWTKQGGKLTPTGAVGNPWFGYTVALSGDGNTALIGGWLDDGWKGAAWVFVRSGSTWTQQGGKLTANDEDGEGMFGTNVTLSADGNTALIGGWNDDSEFGGNRDYSGKGAAWVFTRSGSTWSQQGPKLTANDEAGNGKFGTIVALSANGDTALIGGWNDDHSKGAAWAFTRSGSTWTQQGPKLTGGGETGEGRFGVAVALSADGDTALVGGLADNSTRGAAWLFTRSGTTWTQQGPKLTPSDGAGEGEFGTNVALSGDGATALIGAWRDNSGTGAAWAFVNPPVPTTGPTTGIGLTGARLTGSLGPGGSSTAYFEYGTTAAYGSSTSVQSIGASSGSTPLSASISGLAPGTTYHFRLVAENSGGAIHGTDQTFTTQADAPGCACDPERPPRVPMVENVRQSTRRWRAGSHLATFSRAKPPIGTTFSFSLNEEAMVTFSFTRRVKGRTVTAGKLTFAGHAGTNKVAFQGRISSHKTLKPGRYKLVITAADSAGARSGSKSLSFTIVK